MVINHQLFHNRVANIEKMRTFGFVERDSQWVYRETVLENQFEMVLYYRENDGFQIDAIDCQTLEPYYLLHVVSAQGEVVGQLRDWCHHMLERIAQDCFEIDTTTLNQAESMKQYIEQAHSCPPEYLFEKSPEIAVFRHSTHQKWFGIIMSISRKSLQGNSENADEIVHILNLKATVEHVAERIDYRTIFPAYHMNKKHWYSVVLDNTLKDEEIQLLIQESYDLTKSK